MKNIKLLSLTALFLGVFTLPAMSAPAPKFQSTTEFRVQTNDPNKKDDNTYGVTQSLQYKNGDFTQSISTGWQQFQQGESVIPLRYSVETLAGKVRVRGTIGLDIISDNKDQVYGSFDFSIPVDGNKGEVGGTITSSAFLASSKSLRAGLRAVTFSPRFSYRFNPKTKVLVILQNAWITDGNQRRQATLRVEHNLNKGLYVAGVFEFMDGTKENLSVDYWNPQNRLTYGVEVGARFPVSKNTSCQVGVRPSYVTEESKDGKFGVPFGAGCRIQTSPTSNLTFNASVGYGVNGSVRYDFKF